MEKQEFAVKPQGKEPWDAIIIGSGPAAFTAAIYTTRGAASTLILGGESWGGQLMLTTTVDNYPGFPEGIDGPELMRKMRTQVERFGAEIVDMRASEVNFAKSPYELKAGEKLYSGKSVIIATGADTKWLGVPGEEKLRGRGISSCAPCDAPFFKNKKVVVIGGGDSAMEEAMVLTKYASSVTVVHRRDEFRASEAMQQKMMLQKEKGMINVLWNSEVVEFLGEEKLERLKIKNVKDNSVVEEPFDGAFIAIGHVPATSIFKGPIELDEKGYVKVRDHTMTNVTGVFVAGDVHDYHYRQAITAAGFGCMAGMEALKYLDKAVPSW